MQKSLLVAIEGLDNSGKSTQCAQISSMLQSVGVEVICNTLMTSQIHGVIADAFKKFKFSPARQTLMFTAELLEFFDNHASAALEKPDRVVICDRYVYSFEAYGVAQGLSPSWIRSVSSVFPKPDITVYLDISVDEYQRRVAGEVKRQSPHSAELLEAVRRHYLALAAEFSFFIIEATRPKDVISKVLLREIKQSLSL